MGNEYFWEFWLYYWWVIQISTYKANYSNPAIQFFRYLMHQLHLIGGNRSAENHLRMAVECRKDNLLLAYPLVGRKMASGVAIAATDNLALAFKTEEQRIASRSGKMIFLVEQRNIEDGNIFILGLLNLHLGSRTGGIYGLRKRTSAIFIGYRLQLTGAIHRAPRQMAIER